MEASYCFCIFYVKTILASFRVGLFIGPGRPVYVRCLGGSGRTGTAAGCCLRRHGLAEGKNVIEGIKTLRNDCADAKPLSPETKLQREVAAGWPESA